MKKKVVEWEEKYDKMKKRANEWADKFKLRETDNPIIQELWEFIEEKEDQVAKWRSKVNESVECLKIPHYICSAHANTCMEFDVMYVEYEAMFLPLVKKKTVLKKDMQMRRRLKEMHQQRPSSIRSFGVHSHIDIFILLPKTIFFIFFAC